MFLRPRTLTEAVAALDAPGIQILAGGTDFFPGLGERQVTAPVLDITAIPELSGITIDDREIRIGGRTTWTDVIATPLPACCDALKEAAREVGSVQIQNRGTVAGNLCNASPAADGVPPLLALDAEVELLSRVGTRRLELADFITGKLQGVLPGDPTDETTAAGFVTNAREQLTTNPAATLRFGPAYGLLIVVMIAPPLFRGGFLSLGRLTSTLFPLFLYLGWQLRGTPLAAAVMAFAGLQALLAVVFFTWRPFF